MLKPFLSFPMVRHYLFWILFFLVQRLVFVLYYNSLFNGVRTWEIVQSFFYGFQLDLSMAGYFAVLPLLFLIVQFFISKPFFEKLYHGYTIVLLLLVVLISGGDLGIYENWGVKLNFRAISMLAHPGEVLETVQSSPLWALTSVMLLQAVIGWLLYERIFANVNASIGQWRRFKVKWFATSTILMAGLIFISIRGGVQEIPVNESSVYFSSYSVANHAAVNTPWQLAKSIIKNRRTGNKNIYTYFADPAKAAALVKNLYEKNQSDSSLTVIDTARPNIIFIQLESFTADVVQELGGDTGVAPNLSRFIKEGLLFTNVFASGIRTDQGIIALLSGFPAQPQANIANQSDKVEHLPFLSLELKKQGYYNSFYYGGDLSFGRFNTIAHHAGFETIVGVDDFDEAEMFNKWGADDNSLFKKYVAEKIRPQEPFFSYIITSSSHEPFTVPMQPVFAGEAIGQRFKNACYFADKSLGAFIQSIQETPWFANTLFVVSADHGHAQPKGRAFDIPEKYHIPVLIFGAPLKPEYQGKRINTLGSQTDIAATILQQLKMDASAFKWSNDLLRQNRKEFSFYTFDDGFGWLNKNDTIVYDNRANKLLKTTAIHNNATADSLLNNGKAYMQMLYDAFLKY